MILFINTTSPTQRYFLDGSRCNPTLSQEHLNVTTWAKRRRNSANFKSG